MYIIHIVYILKLTVIFRLCSEAIVDALFFFIET